MFGTTPHSIKITLHDDGTIETLVEGIKGPSCEEATRWLEALGQTIEHSPTPDFYQTDIQGVTVGTGFGF